MFLHQPTTPRWTIWSPPTWWQQGTPKDFVTNVLEVILPANNPANLQTLQDLAKPGLKLVLEDKSVPAGNIFPDNP